MISYYITKPEDVNPYENKALEEVLISQIKADQVILYLWQNDNTVVIGRNQNAWKECRLEAFAEEKGNLVRRLTGGGAVYQDLGNQIFTFIAPKHLYDLDKQMEVIRRAALSFGIKAEKIGRNDVLVDGKKFSGNAFRHTGTASVQHGTLLISTDMSKLAKFLNPSKEKLAAKGVTSVRSRVINLCELNPAITPARMREALITAFQDVYGEVAQPLSEDEIDRNKQAEIATWLASDEWKLGHLSEFDYEFGKRFSFGELVFKFSVEQGTITGIKVYSDALDTDWISGIETAFTGLPFTSVAMADALPASQAPEDTAEVLTFLKALEW